MTKLHALVFSLLMITTSLAGCITYSDDNDDDNDDNNNNDNDYDYADNQDLKDSFVQCNEMPTQEYIEAFGCKVWRVTDINNGNGDNYHGKYMSILVGDTIYFDSDDVISGNELWAYDTSNSSTWRVTDINSSNGDSSPGEYMSILIGDTLYFDADDGSSSKEIWAHDTSNFSTWKVTDINNGNGDNYHGEYMSILIGDTIYFDANDGISGNELWAHDTSNSSTWRVVDLYTGSKSSLGHFGGGGHSMSTLVGDTLYFSATSPVLSNSLLSSEYGDEELWAHNTSNFSTWRVADINSGMESSHPGVWALANDTLYFTAHDGNPGRGIWGHDTSNNSTWRVTDYNNLGRYMLILIGDTLYFDLYEEGNGRELWAHNTYNSSTWRVADINIGTGTSSPGSDMFRLIDDTLYFDADDDNNGSQLWAHDTSNLSTWKVTDINYGSDAFPGKYMHILVGDTLYFDALEGYSYPGNEMWAHNISNSSTWRLTDINSDGGSFPGFQMSILVGDILFFDANDGSMGTELWALRIES